MGRQEWDGMNGKGGMGRQGWDGKGGTGWERYMIYVNVQEKMNNFWTVYIILSLNFR